VVLRKGQWSGHRTAQGFCDVVWTIILDQGDRARFELQMCSAFVCDNCWQLVLHDLVYKHMRTHVSSAIPIIAGSCNYWNLQFLRQQYTLLKPNCSTPQSILATLPQPYKPTIFLTYHHHITPPTLLKLLWFNMASNPDMSKLICKCGGYLHIAAI
jgi:hypothetical protein